MKLSVRWIAMALILGLLASCTPTSVNVPTPTVVSVVTPTIPAAVPTPTGTLPGMPVEATSTVVEPTATTQPAEPEGTATGAPQASDPDVEGLKNLLQSRYGDQGFEGFEVVPLVYTASSPPIWAAHSAGMLPFGRDPLPSHFVAIYSSDPDSWKELAFLSLSDAQAGAGPDILNPGSVRQVVIEPSAVWLQVVGIIGAHGSIGQLLRWDGSQLQPQVWSTSETPVPGWVEDLNGDGLQEYIADQSDAYVLCYACGVRFLNFQVYRYAAETQSMEAVWLQANPEDLQSADPLRRAAALAQAGLWRDAHEAVAEAPAGTGDESAAWNRALIELYADRYRASIGQSQFPLLENVFFGDYQAAFDLLKGEGPQNLLMENPPILQNTALPGYENAVSQYLQQSVTAALAARPNLAPAYFLRGWATYLADPASAAARGDLRQAAQLAPEDPFFQQLQAWLDQTGG